MCDFPLPILQSQSTHLPHTHCHHPLFSGYETASRGLLPESFLSIMSARNLAIQISVRSSYSGRLSTHRNFKSANFAIDALRYLNAHNPKWLSRLTQLINQIEGRQIELALAGKVASELDGTGPPVDDTIQNKESTEPMNPEDEPTHPPDTTTSCRGDVKANITAGRIPSTSLREPPSSSVITQSRTRLPAQREPSLASPAPLSFWYEEAGNLY